MKGKGQGLQNVKELELLETTCGRAWTDVLEADFCDKQKKVGASVDVVRKQREGVDVVVVSVDVIAYARLYIHSQTGRDTYISD